MKGSTEPHLLFSSYLEKIDLAEDWRSTSFRRLALSDEEGEGWRSCEDATMSKSLPVASLFCWFCKYEVHELVYFLTFRKNGIQFCFVLLVTEVKVFYLNDPPFCFWYRNIDMSNFCVGLVGGGRDGWGELRSEPRAAHVFFIFQIKKELFIFIFQIKSISKGNFWKKEQNGKVW